MKKLENPAPKYLDIRARDDKQERVGEVFDKEAEGDSEAVMTVESLQLTLPGVGHPDTILVLVANYVVGLCPQIINSVPPAIRG